ncbi:DUF3352 domain-containing protein [Aerosakkonemataceae cyanobacterium BLCC-F50]|uniref:DUF3352 domain-containing protein n=1 Tax=Floridaenema flaviceps BLCC-F50 TaxID=3153642 RepID=A0ABV4XM73_9CYAN
MSEKKSNWLIPVGIGAAAVIAGGATLGYLYLRGTFSDVSPLASAKIVPDEALMVGFVSPDAKSWAQLQQFGTKEAQQLIGKSLADFNQQMLNESKIDYDKDVKPWLGSVMFAVLPATTTPTPPTPPTPPVANAPNLLFVVGTKDKISLFNFANKLNKSKEKVVESDYKGVKIFESTGKSGKIYTAILGDHLIISEGKKTVESAIDTSKGEPSFASQEGVSSMVTKGVDVPNPVVQIYLPNYGGVIQQLIASNPNAGSLPPETLNQLKMVKSLAAGVGIDNAGIRMKAVAKIDPALNLVTYKPTPGKVISQFPLETVALISGQGINRGWSTFVTQTKTNPGIQQQIDQMRGQLKTNLNLDLDEDVFGWMDGEFALGAVSANQGVLAQLGFGGAFVLKTSDRKTAENTLAKINEVAKTNAINVTQRNIQGKTITEWSSPGQEAWLGYGWLDGESLFIATGGSVVDTMASNSQSLENSPSFKAVTNTLPKPNGGYFYLDMDKTMALMNRNLASNPQSTIPSEASAFLNSIRGIGLTATQPDSSTSQMEILLALKPKSGN